MKYIKKFTEALKPSQFRKYVKEFDRERYADIFKKYDGDKNNYRVYLPLIGEPTLKNPIELEVTNFLNDNGFEIVDYIKGTCKATDAKNLSKIGQILTRKKSDLLNKFVSDPERKAGTKEDLMVVISRHPYDIAGADTDRTWTNCMTLSHPDSEKTKSMEDKLKILTDKRKKILYDLSQSTIKKDEMDIDGLWDNSDNCESCYGGGCEDCNDTGNKSGLAEEKDILREESKKLENELEEVDFEIKEVGEKIDARIGGGVNAHYLLYDVKEGSLISYLVKKSDLNIKNPLATLNIKPYLNEDDESDMILVSDNSSYGLSLHTVPEFKTTVDKWLEEVNGKSKDGWYCLKNKLYNDSTSRIEIYSDKSVDRIINEIKNGKLDTYDFLKRYLKDGNISEDDLRRVVSNIHIGYLSELLNEIDENAENFYPFDIPSDFIDIIVEAEKSKKEQEEERDSKSKEKKSKKKNESFIIKFNKFK